MRRYIFYTGDASTMDINLFGGTSYSIGERTVVTFPTPEDAALFDAHMPGSSEGWQCETVDILEDNADPTVLPE